MLITSKIEGRMLIFLINLIITILVEVVANKFLFKNKDFRIPTNKVIIANSISNPLAQIGHRMFFINLWPIELAVIIFEFIFYFSRNTNYRQALTISLILNVTSVLVGFFIHSLLVIL